MDAGAHPGVEEEVEARGMRREITARGRRRRREPSRTKRRPRERSNVLRRDHLLPASQRAQSLKGFGRDLTHTFIIRSQMSGDPVCCSLAQTCHNHVLRVSPVLDVRRRQFRDDGIRGVRVNRRKIGERGDFSPTTVAGLTKRVAHKRDEAA